MCEGRVKPTNSQDSGRTLVQRGENVRVHLTAVVGLLPVVSDASSVPTDGTYGAAQLGDNVQVLAGAQLFASCCIKADCIIGNNAIVRELVEIGTSTVIGAASIVDREVTIGNQVRIQSQCFIAGSSKVYDNVFIGPGLITTNDNSMGRSGREAHEGVIIEAGARIGGGVVICPGVTIGRGAYVCAGAVVTKDVAPNQAVAGTPARSIKIAV